MLACSLMLAGLLGLRRLTSILRFIQTTTCQLFQIKICLWTRLVKYTVFYDLLSAKALFRLLEMAKGTDNPHQFSIYSQACTALSPIDFQLEGVLAKQKTMKSMIAALNSFSTRTLY